MLEEIESEYFNNILKKEYNILAEKQKPFVEKIFLKFKNKLELEIIEDDRFGLNFSFTGKTGSYYFPAVIWYVQSYREAKKYLVEMSKLSSINLADFQKKISEFILEQVKTRTGFTLEILECLNFFSRNNSGPFYSSENIISDEMIISNYKPEFLPLFSKEIIKNNFTNITQILGNYVIPNNNFWNIGSILLEPSFNYDINDETYPVFPYWSISKTNRRDSAINLFSLYRISPSLFVNNFEFKYQIVNSFNFFMNFKYFSKSESNLFVFKLPDLFSLFDIFENQNFELAEEKSISDQSLTKPNWSLSIKSPKKISNQRALLDNNENDRVNDFLIQNLNVIAHLYNQRLNSKLINFRKIMENVDRKNIFNNIFEKRLSLDKNNYNITFIIWIKTNKNRQKKYKNNIINFFSSILPTGLIIDYHSGLLLYLSLYHKNEKTFYSNLVKFLDFLNFEYKIYKEFNNSGFLLYSLPPSSFFVNGRWNFPQTKLQISNREFNDLTNSIKEKEKIIENNNENIIKIRKFGQFMQKF